LIVVRFFHGHYDAPSNTPTKERDNDTFVGRTIPLIGILVIASDVSQIA